MAMDIVQLIRSGESQAVEFKQSTGELREIGETVSAFANTQGGTILIGVSNAGDVLGVTIGKGTLESLANAIQQQTDPKVFPSLTLTEVEGKSVIILHVEESSLKPVLVQGRAFRRVGRSNHVLSSAEIANLSLASRQMSWDAGPAETQSLADIDEAAIRRFLTTARRERNLDLDPEAPVTEALEKLDLVREQQPTRAAVLLFGKEPQRFLPPSEARVARFKGNEPLHFLDMKVLKGRLMEQRDAIVDFIQRHISMAAEIKGLQREERWEYPLAALREAVTNALCHRDYRDSGNVQVRIFDHRLEVWSPGLLPEGVTIADLSRTHRSVPRNRLIADVFFLAGLIEQWGTGTLRMIEECRSAGLPEPEFSEVSGAFVVTFHQSKLTQEHLAKLGLNDRQREAVEHVRQQGRITNHEYAQLVGVSRRTATRDLTALVEKGLFRQTGKGKGSYFELT